MKRGENEHSNSIFSCLGFCTGVSNNLTIKLSQFLKPTFIVIKIEIKVRIVHIDATYLVGAQPSTILIFIGQLVEFLLAYLLDHLSKW